MTILKSKYKLNRIVNFLPPLVNLVSELIFIRLSWSALPIKFSYTNIVNSFVTHYYVKYTQNEDHSTRNCLRLKLFSKEVSYDA